MTVRIITDSCSDLPPRVAREYGITVLPLYVNIGDRTYRDGVEIDADRFYSLLPDLPVQPTTSQPSPSDFQEVYRRLLDEGHEIVSVHVSGKLSGTLNSAVQAKASLGDPPELEIVDSRLAGGAQALLALSAARWAGGTVSASEVAQRMRRSIPGCHGFVCIDTLKYLEKGRRIGKAQAFLGGALRFKPIIAIRDGEAQPCERPRTRREAKKRIIELVRRLGPLDQLHVSYSTGPDLARDICEELAGLVEPENLIQARFGPVLGAHPGPNTIGVAATQRSLAEW